MQFIKNFIFVFIASTLIVIGYAQDAHAYIDPASGSYLLQFLIAGLLGGLFALKMYWKRLKLKISALFSKKDVTDSEHE